MNNRIAAASPRQLARTAGVLSLVNILVGFFALGYNATFIPRLFGPLLAIDGIGYLTNAFASMISPDFAARLVPYILLPIVVAEGSLCLWFLIFGVDERRWAEKAKGRRPRRLHVAAR